MLNPNYGITLELAGFRANLTEGDRRLLSQAFVAAIGRALVIMESKNPVGPFEVYAKFEGQQFEEAGDALERKPANVQIVISAADEPKIIRV